MPRRRLPGRPVFHIGLRREALTIYANDDEMQVILRLTTQERKVALLQASRKLHPEPQEEQTHA